jgi:tRNA threonylcarbamoyladenosine biosynthesis protein TsaE
MTPFENMPRAGALEVETQSADETRRLGLTLTPMLLPGDVLSLSGDLGAGKTTLVQGMAVGLNIHEWVTSPSYILMKEYAGGRYSLIHLDVYRLGRIQEVIDLGLDEFLDPRAIVVIEWGDMIAPLLPSDHLVIELTHTDEDARRRVTITARGRGWEDRMTTLKALASELFSPREFGDGQEGGP